MRFGLPAIIVLSAVVIKLYLPSVVLWLVWFFLIMPLGIYGCYNAKDIANKPYVYMKSGRELAKWIGIWVGSLVIILVVALFLFKSKSPYEDGYDLAMQVADCEYKHEITEIQQEFVNRMNKLNSVSKIKATEFAKGYNAGMKEAAKRKRKDVRDEVESRYGR